MALKGIGPFATYLIVGSTCFFLGILFGNLPYDYFILWSQPWPTEADPDPMTRYFALQESHVKFLHASPPLISRLLNLVIGVGLLGFLMKLYRPTEANKLFDGASLALYMVGITVYATNIVKGMRAATAGVYGNPELAEDPVALQKSLDSADAAIVGREDTLRVIAASNTILAFILIGILVLQAGQWYAQRKEAQEMEIIDKARDDKRKEKALEKAEKTDKSSKKKQ
ncbi:Shr3 amino acid permease chaperone [Neohortaea acidophila]|uniref:Shr3 amino acid permease chaperone n=1 Tax=Neohortaea acidophila TaxID=245834 RepID=A0A6A6PM60_9PEZI|nr:Shr3 amino acid permease chaperone [Neohortaea acidophila]KAF2480781.1 Shr3 amino acid permease chaperone [Neohortaea acidophila]